VEVGDATNSKDLVHVCPEAMKKMEEDGVTKMLISTCVRSV
jgi:hypothetical protein